MAEDQKIETLDVNVCELFLAERFFISPEQDPNINGGVLPFFYRDYAVEEREGYVFNRNQLSIDFFENFKQLLQRVNSLPSGPNLEFQPPHAVIAGGSILNSYHKFDYDTSDIDLYVHSSSATNITTWLCEHHFTAEATHIAPAYDQSFFRKNHIMARIRFVIIRTRRIYNIRFRRFTESLEDYDKRKYNNATFLDVLIIPDAIPLTQVVTNFDLSFCQAWYDGTHVYSDHRQDVLSKRGKLQEDYQESLFRHLNSFIIERIKKYQRRGFHINIVYRLPAQFELVPEQKTVVDWEEWTAKYFYYYVRSLLVHNYPHLLEIPDRLTNTLNGLSIFRLQNAFFLCKFPLYPYTKRNVDTIIIETGLLDLIGNLNMVYLQALEMNIHNNNYFKLKVYFQQIKKWLGFSTQEYLKYKETLRNNKITQDLQNLVQRGDLGQIDNIINENAKETEFKEDNTIENNIPERRLTGTCIDIDNNVSKSVQEHLSQTNSYLFITPREILCLSYSYLRSIYDNKNEWMYECDGEIISPIGEEVEEKNKYNNRFNLNEPYCKITVGSGGAVGLIKVVYISRLLYLYRIFLQQTHRGFKRVYHLHPIQDREGNDIKFSHTSQRSSFTSGPEYGETPHCQSGTSMYVYEIKQCNLESCAISRGGDLAQQESTRVLEEDDSKYNEDEEPSVNGSLNFDGVDDVGSGDDVDDE